MFTRVRIVDINQKNEMGNPLFMHAYLNLNDVFQIIETEGCPGMFTVIYNIPSRQSQDVQFLGGSGNIILDFKKISKILNEKREPPV
jgi:hypothetical protein